MAHQLVIGLDIGHSAVKIAVGSTTDIFPAFAIPAATSSVASVDSVSAQDTVQVDGAPYFVGQSALVHSPDLALDDLREGWIETPEHTALLLAGYRRGLALAGSADASEPIVALGLPSRLYQSQVARLTELAQLHLGLPKARIVAIPQALAAFMAFVLDNDGVPRTDMAIEGTAWGVIDVGYFTTDFGLLRDGVWSVPGAKSAHGASAMASEIQARINSTHGVGLSLLECDAIVRNRVARLWGKQVDCSREAGEAIEGYTHMLAKQAAQVFGSALPTLNGVLLVGGGATAVADSLRKHIPHIQISKEIPLRFSVVEGLRRYAIMLNNGIEGA